MTNAVSANMAFQVLQNEIAHSVACPACQSEASNHRGRISGYVRGPMFDIWECALCKSQAARPAEVPKGLYDAIYANAARIEGGYARYERYAREILEKPCPWDWLAEQEDMYWGVHRLLHDAGLDARAAILEIGCGLGYLTYALRGAGFDAHGIDLSSVAVTKARHNFGDHYSAGDAIESTRTVDAEAVIAMELIEHLPDPAAFLMRLRAVMHRESILILSTPNRDTYDAGSLWNTDLPPVHLHWFSEDGLRALAQRCGFEVNFADFTERNCQARRTRWIAGPQYRAPRFDEALLPLDAPSPPRVASISARRIIRGITRRTHRLLLAAFNRDENRLVGRRSVGLVANLSPK